MLVLLSDTHGEDSPRLTDHVRERVEAASVVVHAGDFTTEAVLEAFERRTPELVAVAGNSDTAAVRERLPGRRTFDFAGRRFLVTHGHRRDRTSLSLLARQEGADVVVVGHTHRAGVDDAGGVALVNPGSHADPRGGRPTFAVVAQVGDDLQVRLRTAAGREWGTAVL